MECIDFVHILVENADSEFGEYEREHASIKNEKEVGVGFLKEKPMAQRPVLPVAQDGLPHDGGQNALKVSAQAEEGAAERQGCFRDASHRERVAHR